MKRTLMLLLLLPAALMAQERSLLPVVSGIPDTVRTKRINFGVPGSKSYISTGESNPRSGSPNVVSVGTTLWAEKGFICNHDGGGFTIESSNTNYGATSMALYTAGSWQWYYGSKPGLRWQSPYPMMIEGSAASPAASQLSRFNVAGGIRADTVTTPIAQVQTLVVDSARMRVVVIDTTGWVTLDSLQYRISKIETPVTRTFGVATQHFKVGFVEVDVHGLCSPNNIPRYFNWRSDSANGVKIAGMEMDYNWESYASGNYMSLHYIKYIGWISNNNGLYTSGTLLEINPQGQAVGPTAVQTGSPYFFRYHIPNNSNFTLYTAKFRVKVYMPVTSSSTWYVRPTNS